MFTLKRSQLPGYPQITPAELERLQPDEKSALFFERRFRSGLLGGVAMAFGGPLCSIALHHFRAINEAGFAIGFIAGGTLGMMIALWAHHRMMRTRPRSVRTGNLMEPFVIQQDANPDKYELAYVDHASSTYFKRVYID